VERFREVTSGTLVGEHITPEAAAILIRGAQYVTNRLVQQIPRAIAFIF